MNATEYINESVLFFQKSQKKINVLDSVEYNRDGNIGRFICTSYITHFINGCMVEFFGRSFVMHEVVCISSTEHSKFIYMPLVDSIHKHRERQLNILC